jgi:hypothetical protein
LPGSELASCAAIDQNNYMNFRKITAIGIFTAFLAATSICFGGSRANKGSTEGTFAGIEQGDYAHLLLKDKKGKQESYFILRPDRSVQSYLDHPKELKGRRIRVHWEERNENIPEAGGKMRIKVVTKVDART